MLNSPAGKVTSIITSAYSRGCDIPFHHLRLLPSTSFQASERKGTDTFSLHSQQSRHTRSSLFHSTPKNLQCIFPNFVAHKKAQHFHTGRPSPASSPARRCFCCCFCVVFGSTRTPLTNHSPVGFPTMSFMRGNFLSISLAVSCGNAVGVELLSPLVLGLHKLTQQLCLANHEHATLKSQGSSLCVHLLPS